MPMMLLLPSLMVLTLLTGKILIEEYLPQIDEDKRLPWATFLLSAFLLAWTVAKGIIDSAGN